MWIECFKGDEHVEGSDADALVERMLAHIRSTHDVSYDDDEIRLWARNFGDASEREDGPVERLASIGEINVQPVTEERIDDWLRFFDRDAFPDNPDWGSCYCLHPHEGDGPERPWRDLRADMIERLRAGATIGYLAYAAGRVAGWVNASLRSTYRKYDGLDPDGPDPASVVGVSCFVVAPPFRRHGVSSALLGRVVADGADRGARFIEGYPRAGSDGGDAAEFCGPRSLFDAHGFDPARDEERFTVMRRTV